MNLRAHPVEETVATPDGRELRVRVGVAADPYVSERALDTVGVEVFDGDEVLAVVNTALALDEDSEARAIARDIATGLADGSVEPTTTAIEPIALRSN